MSREIIAKSAIYFIHRIHETTLPKEIYNQFKYPVRSLINNYPSITEVPKTERMKRGAIYASLNLFKRVDINLIGLSHYQFKKTIKSVKINVLSKEEQNNW